jgi:ribokinase
VVVARGANQLGVAPGPNAGLTAADVDDALAAVAAEHDSAVVLVSFEIPEEAVDAACVAASRLGWPLVVNPAPARPLRPSTYGPGTILTPNAHEARELVGVQPDGGPGEQVPPAIARLLDDGLRGVAVTLGSRGAVLNPAGGAPRGPAPAARAVHTTGAGDVFNGALAAALAGAAALPDAVAAGVDAASRAVARPRRGLDPTPAVE